jgi:hypothetical protein
MNPVKAWVVSVHMGLGHLRAAYPLRDMANEDIITNGYFLFYAIPRNH